MRKTAMTIVAMLLLIGLSALSTAEHGAGDERSSTFIGSTTTKHDLNQACADALEEEECPTRIIQGIIFINCDYSDGTFDPAGLYDSLGGVSFCDIPMGATVTLQYTNVIAAADFEGSVTCPETDDEGLNWNTEFGVLSGEAPADFEVPDWCNEASPGGHEGHTSVNIFNTAASLSSGGGTATVGFIVEGELTLIM